MSRIHGQALSPYAYALNKVSKKEVDKNEGFHNGPESMRVYYGGVVGELHTLRKAYGCEVLQSIVSQAEDERL